MLTNLPASETVAIDSLDVSGRLRPPDPGHVRALAEVLDETPPVRVLLDGRRVVDGFMRLDAARSLDRSTARVEWVTGEEAVAWEQAIRTNASHGLPLTARQRREAALRLLSLAPDWSDRRIATAAGVAPRSVGRWRKEAEERAGEKVPRLSTAARVGRDGRRHLSTAELETRRAVARELLQGPGDLSDREVGRRAGLSAAAVRRLRGEPPQSAPRAALLHRTASAVTRMFRSARQAGRRITALLARLLNR